MQVSNSFPGDAAKGADYVTGAAQDQIVMGPDSVRPERVIITDLFLEHEGRVCLGERSVRHMANLLGMYEAERVDIIVAQNGALRSEIDVKDSALADCHERIIALEEAGLSKVYVATNGTEFTSLDAAIAYQAPLPDVVPVSDPLATPTPQQIHDSIDQLLDDQLAELHDKILDTIYARATAPSTPVTPATEPVPAVDAPAPEPATVPDVVPTEASDGPVEVPAEPEATGTDPAPADIPASSSPSDPAVPDVSAPEVAENPASSSTDEAPDPMTPEAPDPVEAPPTVTDPAETASTEVSDPGTVETNGPDAGVDAPAQDPEVPTDALPDAPVDPAATPSTSDEPGAAADPAPEGDAAVEPAPDAADPAPAEAADAGAPVTPEVPDAATLAAMPKPELAGLASDLNLPGRSTMTKDELVAAIPDHAATLAAEPEAGA